MAILHIVGTRPNFVKAASVMEAFGKSSLSQFLIHTGQHYDYDMSGTFFNDLKLPVPDLFLDAKNSLPLSIFISTIYDGIKKICQTVSPQIVVLYGDVNSTMAAAIACQKLNIPIAHVEAGLRSFDNNMKEETNRILVDHLSSLLFTTESSANENLLSEGIAAEKIHFVGNCMIDTLVRFLPFAITKNVPALYGLKSKNYILCTFHRPSNILSDEKLNFIFQLLNAMSKIYPVIFPIHPRTKKAFEKHAFKFSNNILFCNPLPYLDFVGLMADCSIVITDSGGVQEETTWLNIPCLTLRQNTERPITIYNGTNTLVDKNIEEIVEKIKKSKMEHLQERKEIEKWDGKAGERIVKVIEDFLG
jgi:UDP-N-acetylglucosamine 2-epimerase (non-hydrolysing)